jgi:lipopolysaccharide/colanic/teichoic acid biosynthesis glycosyltransferase
MTIRTSANQAAKWIFDRSVSLVLLVLLLPLMLLIALAVRLTSKGPALFRQERLGRHERPFKIIKFRTMKHPAGSFQVSRSWDDPRLTPVGKLLRRTRLDELPQLWNVLIGQMSFVGPRPHVPEYAQGLKAQYPLYEQRFGVRQGITSMSKLRGGAPSERVAANADYVHNWTFLGDLRILAMTARWFVHSLHHEPEFALDESEAEAAPALLATEPAS